jgi:hypothetical protein
MGVEEDEVEGVDAAEEVVVGVVVEEVAEVEAGASVDLFYTCISLLRSCSYVFIHVSIHIPEPSRLLSLLTSPTLLYNLRLESHLSTLPKSFHKYLSHTRSRRQHSPNGSQSR